MILTKAKSFLPHVWIVDENSLAKGIIWKEIYVNGPVVIQICFYMQYVIALSVKISAVYLICTLRPDRFMLNQYASRSPALLPHMSAVP